MSLKLWDGLKEVCKASEQELLEDARHSGYAVHTVNKDRYYAFKDNGSNILAVAHMDTVRPNWQNFKFDKKERMVVSPALDDRLGVFILTKILPVFGVLPDILLTTDEEIGRSTAEEFAPSKEYNWIFSFDRSGDDVVMYDYETIELWDMLEDNGFTPAWGSFSDICYLEHLGVSGFNFGTGYYNEHTKKCFAMLDIVSMMVAKFIEFYNRFKDDKFEYIPTPWSGFRGLGKYDEYEEYKDKFTYAQYYDAEDEKWHDYKPVEEDDYDDYDDWDEWLEDELVSMNKAISFTENHEDMNCDIESFPMDDRVMCVMCYTHDEYIYFKDR